MDMTVLFSLSYGVYAIGVRDGDRPCGCIVNAATQVKAEPPTMAVSIAKNNYTSELLKNGAEFTLSILSEKTAPLDITFLGFQSGRERDKFASVEHAFTESGVPFVTGGACGYLVCRVTDSHDCDTHTMFFADIVDCVKLTDNVPMTYDYYHKVIKGKAPKNAPTYQA